MPGRGFVCVTALVAIALACLTVTRKLERERRLLAKLRKRAGVAPGSGLRLDDLSEDERDAAASLARSGVVEIRQGHCTLRAAELGRFRSKRMRLVITGGFGALVLACLVALLILRR